MAAAIIWPVLRRARLIIDKARGQRATVLAASHLIEDSTAQPGLEDVKLGLAHGSFKAEQEPIVEAHWIVDAILVKDQRVGQRADLQQAMPVRVVPRRRDTSRPMTMPACPMPTLVTRR